MYQSGKYRMNAGERMLRGHGYSTGPSEEKVKEGRQEQVAVAWHLQPAPTVPLLFGSCFGGTLV
ncbi:hypothetical protein V8C40DRAFT_230085 [Trichoderma camerunense]